MPRKEAIEEELDKVLEAQRKVMIAWESEPTHSIEEAEEELKQARLKFIEYCLTQI